MITRNPHIDYIRLLTAKGGPDPEDYAALDRWNAEMARRAAAGEISGEEKQALVDSLGDALSSETMQGFAYRKPHGYPGYFEIIDRIYTRYVSPSEELRKWDLYLHRQEAPQAVRNRKELFCRMLDGLGEEPKRILNIASGPARDVHDWMGPGKPRHHITCLDMDPKAVEHAKGLVGDKQKQLNGNAPEIKFIVGNALRFRPNQTYDLIWSGGLFDYFSDRVFTAMIKRLAKLINPGGGNRGGKLRNLQSLPALHGIRGAMGVGASVGGTAPRSRPRRRHSGSAYRNHPRRGGGESVSADPGGGARMIALTMRPGGKLLIANLDPDAANLGYCEAIMDWWMIPKSRHDFEELGSFLGEQVSDRQVLRHGCFNYLVCTKERSEVQISCSAAK